MSISPRVINKAQSFKKLFIEERLMFKGYRNEHWIATMKAFRRIADNTSRKEVVEKGKKLSSYLVEHLPSASAALLGEVAFTYGKLGLYHPKIINSCKNAHLKGATVKDLTRQLWGQTLLKSFCINHYLNVACAIEVHVARNPKIALDDCRRLHMTSLAGRVCWKEDVLGPETRRVVDIGMKKLAILSTNPSCFQKSVTSFVAKNVPEEWQMETEYYYEGYRIDIAFPKQMIAIEVDGPYHFYPESDESVTKDRLKDYILKGLGWNVVHITYRQWDKGYNSNHFRGRIFSELTRLKMDTKL